MEIRNLTAHDRDIPNVGIIEAGGTLEVDNDLGKSLCEQTDVFEKVAAKRSSSEKGAS
jgi:hypothetical protein